MTMRIVIVGGGVVGASIAWHLARAGAGAVTLLERDRLGAGTTWHSAGNITWKPAPSHDAAVLYMLETIGRLEKETGQSTGWLTTGRTFIARTAQTRAELERLDRAARERGIAARWLEPAEARALNTLIEPGATEGIWLNPVSGRLNPADITAAYAAGARQHGARIREGAAVTAVATEGGRATGVVTADGVVPADTVIVAAGLWSRALLLPLGTVLAQWPCEHMYLIADVRPRLARETPSFVAPDDLVYGREEVGGMLVGFFDENAKTLDPASLPEPFSFTLLEPDHDKIAPYFEGAMEVFPALASAPVRRFINGPESFTPDGQPLVGRLPGIEGLIVATAMNSAGVTWSAMVGSLVADLVAGRAAGPDGGRLDPARFGGREADRGWLEAAVSDIVASGYRKQNR